MSTTFTNAKFITPVESLEERFEPGQVSRMYTSLLNELDRGIEMHKDYGDVGTAERCSILCLDTYITTIPTGREKGCFYGVDFGGSWLKGIYISVDANGKRLEVENNLNIREYLSTPERPKGLLDKTVTATEMFDTIATTVKELLQKTGNYDPQGEPIPLGFSFSFAVEKQTTRRAILTSWAKGFETGCMTSDPVENRDVCALLNVALKRNNVPAFVNVLLNDTVAALACTGYECPRGAPPCGAAMIIGTGFNGCYLLPNSEDWGYEGKIVNVELGRFNRELPWNIFDIEVDFASIHRGKYRLEKMISSLYLPELCRRATVKLFQDEAPKAAWTHNTLTCKDCADIVEEDSSTFQVTQKILEERWNWSPPLNYVDMLKTLFTNIFCRSAALAAISLAGMVKKTGLLQPAIGGLTVGIEGSLYCKNPKYRDMLSQHLNDVLGEDTARLMHIVVCDKGASKGAALLSGILKDKEE